jgi:ABC-type multidrug transport system fused ATPase/permease subunit
VSAAGCGKSTLMTVLFRMVEPCGGALLIDGLNTCDVGLTDLRCAVAVWLDGIQHMVICG